MKNLFRRVIFLSFLFYGLAIIVGAIVIISDAEAQERRKEITFAAETILTSNPLLYREVTTGESDGVDHADFYVKNSAAQNTPLERIEESRNQFNEPALAPFFDCYGNFTNRLTDVSINPALRAPLIDGFARELDLQLNLQGGDNGWNNLRSEFGSRTYCSVFWTAFAGVIAHIGYDLVFALARNFSSPEELQSAAADYFRIGDELRSTVPEMQSLLVMNYDSGIGILSALTPFDLDAFISSFIISSIRQASFKIALSYLSGELTDKELQQRALSNYKKGIRTIDRIEALIRPSGILKNYCKVQ